MVDKVTLEASIARIEANIEALKAQADHAGRTAEQLVRLVEERLHSKFEAVGVRFDGIERRLDDMEASRAAARTEQAATLAALRKEHTDELSAIAVRLTAVELWKEKVANRAVGIAVGMTLASGSVAAFLVSAMERFLR